MRFGRTSSMFCVLRLSILLWHVCSEALGANMNVTLDDSDPSILYEPPQFWYANADGCATCLRPATSLAFNNTYHFGMHNITLDEDDMTSTQNPTLTGADNKGPGKDGDEDDHDDDDHDDRDRKHRRRTVSQRLDADDPGFVDSVVTAQFKFTGSAVYLYCVEPQAPSSSPTTPTNMNLSFTLDNTPSGSFIHTGSSPASGFASNVSILALENLTQSPHVLLVTVWPESVLAFDYMVYTTEETEQTSAPSATPTGVAEDVQSTTHRNVATFAGAIGGTVGVLGTFSFCLFLSIWRRRRRSAKRESIRARDRESASSADDSPPMIGPRPFVPRYFPRTGPAPPPPYIAPTDSAHTPISSLHMFPASSRLESVPPPLYVSRDHQDPAVTGIVSYADIPPSTPPLEMDQIMLGVSTSVALPPPPPFGVATATSTGTLDSNSITLEEPSHEATSSESSESGSHASEPESPGTTDTPAYSPTPVHLESPPPDPQRDLDTGDAETPTPAILPSGGSDSTEPGPEVESAPGAGDHDPHRDEGSIPAENDHVSRT